jgi:hypothetical protein
MKTPKRHVPVVNLPSFLRRVLKAYALKANIRALGCELSRIGRSRNWQLTANFEKIERVISMVEDSEEETWQWVALHLRKQHKNLSFDMLLAIAQKKPEITVSELMARTDCTIAQARQVIDKVEFDD